MSICSENKEDRKGEEDIVSINTRSQGQTKSSKCCMPVVSETMPCHQLCSRLRAWHLCVYICSYFQRNMLPFQTYEPVWLNN